MDVAALNVRGPAPRDACADAVSTQAWHAVTLRFALRSAFAASVALAPLIGACGDRNARPATSVGGTVVVAWRNDPDALVPPLAATVESREIVDLVFDRLAIVKPGGSALGDSGFAPRLARRWTWSPDSLSIRFELDERSRWHDGHPLRADDIVFSLAVYRDTLVASTSAADLGNVDSITAPDPLTAVAWFHKRTPLQFNDLVMNLVPIPEHLWRAADRSKLIADPQALAPVGSGQFRFARWDANQQLVLVADSTHPRGRPALDRIIWRWAPDDQTNLARLLAGEVDVLDIRTDEQLTRVQADSMLRTEWIPGFSYGVVQFNLRTPAGDAPHPILGERALRRALAMATDRAVLVKSTFGDLANVAFGPFVRAQFSADTTVPQLPFDPAAARRTLDSLGWRVTGAGVRALRGRPLRLSVLVPIGSPSVQLATLLQSQWRDVGVDLRIEPLDGMRSGRVPSASGSSTSSFVRFVTTQGFASLPQTWGTSGGNPGRPQFRPLPQSRVRRRGRQRARERFRRRTIRAHLRSAYTTIIPDAPAIFVYETRGVLAAPSAPRHAAAERRRLVVPHGVLVRLPRATTPARPGGATRQQVSHLLAARVLQGLIVAVVVAALTFFLVKAAPGDPFADAMSNPGVDAAMRDRWSHAWGLDRPAPEQFVRWAASMARGDFGYSFSQRRPVLNAIRGALPYSVLLMGTSLILSVVIGVGVALLQARRRTLPARPAARHRDAGWCRGTGGVDRPRAARDLRPRASVVSRRRRDGGLRHVAVVAAWHGRRRTAPRAAHALDLPLSAPPSSRGTSVRHWSRPRRVSSSVRRARVDCPNGSYGAVTSCGMRSRRSSH